MLQRRRFYSNDGWDQLIQALQISNTIYVGNLAFFTTEEQIYELFSRCGEVERVIMGLNKETKDPCGFCFVEYYSDLSAKNAKKYISGTKLDDRVIRADLDPGFEEGRQYGRSKRNGGQIRDDYRQEYDAGRGGWGQDVVWGEPQQPRVTEARSAKRSKLAGGISTSKGADNDDGRADDGNDNAKNDGNVKNDDNDQSHARDNDGKEKNDKHDDKNNENKNGRKQGKEQETAQDAEMPATNGEGEETTISS